MGSNKVTNTETNPIVGFTSPQILLCMCRPMIGLFCIIVIQWNVKEKAFRVSRDLVH